MFYIPTVTGVPYLEDAWDYEPLSNPKGGGAIIMVQEPNIKPDLAAGWHTVSRLSLHSSSSKSHHMTWLLRLLIFLIVLTGHLVELLGQTEACCH